MYDTLKLWLENRYAVHSIKYIDNAPEIVDANTGLISSNGYLNNLYYKINSNGVSLSGSIAKYYYGNNLEQLGRKETSEVIEKLSDKLHLPIKLAKVNRIDIGANLSVKKSLNNYFNCLGDKKYLERIHRYTKNSLTYHNKLRSLSFYDKIQDCKRCKIPIPDIYRNCNILRYEFRLTKRINKTLKKEKVYAEDLYNPEMYKKLIDLWKQEYFSIERRKDQKLIKAIIQFVDTRKILYSFANQSINYLHGGTEKIIYELKDAKVNNEISKDKYYKLRRKILEISNDPEISEPNEAILELDEKVRNTNLYYR